MDRDAYALMLRRLSALERRVSAVFRTGQVATVQLSPYRVRVDVGPDDAGEPVITDLLPVLVPRSGEVRAWSPLTVSERVSVLSPGGEDVSAFVLPGLVGGDFEAASDAAGRVVTRFSVLDDPETEAGHIEVVRAATVAQSAMTMAVGESRMTLRGDGHIQISNVASSITMNLTDLLLDSPHLGLND